MNSRKAWLPWALGACLSLAVIGPALDPGEQLFYRDTIRCAYHFKQFIAGQLRAGRSPFWDPWTESGTSVLVQITPGLFHPATLLYALPFELAFKLNHLLAIPLAWAGLFLLARRLGASAWGAAAGACGYAACGYLPSVVSSNLHFALGAATVPLAVHGLLRFADRPRPLRLLWAAYALALCFYGGEPQSMLLAGFLGALYLAVERRRQPLLAAGLIAAWGGCSLLLAAPAVLPVVSRVLHSPRLTSAEEFANAPARLLGLLLPRAFDNRGGAFGEYFSQDAFIDCIVVGAPVLLLALLSGTRGRCLALAGALFALGSAGGPVLRLLQLAVPGLSLFRYPEKLIGPASLLFCLAAALGATRLEEQTREMVKPLIAAAAVLALAALGFWLGQSHLAALLQPHGRTGAPALARELAGSLSWGLLCEAALAAVLAGLALPGLRRQTAPLVAALCAVAGLLQTKGAIDTEPLELVHAPLALAEELKSAAGPSEGRWRLRAGNKLYVMPDAGGLRRSRMQAVAQALEAPFHALARVEGVNEYTSLADLDYSALVQLAPKASNQLLGVRFDVQTAFTMDANRAAGLGYHRAAFGSWVKEFPERPRAFLAGCALTLPDHEGALRWLASPRFQIGEAVTRIDAGLPCPAQQPGGASLPRVAEPGSAALRRPSADRMEVATSAAARSLLIVSEHFDPGWRATIDGRPAQVLQADLAALAVAVPEGKHDVRLHFVPEHLFLGLLLCAACAGALLLLELLHRDHRVGAAEAK